MIRIECSRNSAAILNMPIPPEPLGRVLDRTPGRASNLLKLVAQNGTGKLYRVNNLP